MRILGIDPGTLKLGYGLIDEIGSQIEFVDCGVFVEPSNISLERRLSSLYRKLCAIISKYCPDEVAIEEPFVSNNVRSAMAIGRAQTIAILAASERQIPIFRYLPTHVKQQVTNYGGSSKEQVQDMVRIQLNLSVKPLSIDASDALAIAICHRNERHLNNILAEG